MTEQQPRVIIIEDDDGWQSVISRVLTGMGCLVVGTASSMETALALIAKLDEQQVNIVSLDGNLSRGRNDGEEGKQLARDIRARAPGVKIIGVSGGDQPYADGHIDKSDFDKEKMRAVFFPKT